jgi:LPPG:FO 2-phospho-L-lactate transferase
VESAVLPMSDDPVSTILDTPEGRLEFQEYFVRRGQRDEVSGIELRGIEDAGPTQHVLAAISDADVIVLCPSNPVVSIGPILALPGMTEALASSSAPKVAVSPIVGGRALKGPADRMLASLGHEVSSTGVARMYTDLVNGMVVDLIDEDEREAIESIGMRVLATDAVMRDEADRERLGREVLEFCSELSVA